MGGSEDYNPCLSISLCLCLFLSVCLYGVSSPDCLYGFYCMSCVVVCSHVFRVGQAERDRQTERHRDRETERQRETKRLYICFCCLLTTSCTSYRVVSTLSHRVVSYRLLSCLLVSNTANEQLEKLPVV